MPVGFRKGRHQGGKGGEERRPSACQQGRFSSPERDRAEEKIRRRGEEKGTSEMKGKA